MHFNGQSTVNLNGDKASGITYCRAYHLNVQDGVQRLMIAGIRYYDIMVKTGRQVAFCRTKIEGQLD
jgi:hypothetical protein